MAKFFFILYLLLSAHAYPNSFHQWAEKIIDYEQSHFLQGNIEDIAYIQSAIQIMYDTDQTIRHRIAFHSLKDPLTEKLLLKMDTFHSIKMKAFVERYRWFPLSKFGHNTNNQAWLLVQHFDHDSFFQEKCLNLMQPLINNNETSKKNYAYLYDRIAIKKAHLGIKQKYGTQLEIVNGNLVLYPYEDDLDTLNVRRKEMGLCPVEEYINEIKCLFLN